MQQGIAHLLIVAVVAVVIFGMAIEVLLWKNNLPVPVGQKTCTQETKVCPDGTSVGRTGQNCEFATCPSPSGLLPTKTQQDQELTPEMRSQIQPVIDTVNWRAYNGSELPIYLQYPPNWELKVSSDFVISLIPPNSVDRSSGIAYIARLDNPKTYPWKNMNNNTLGVQEWGQGFIIPAPNHKQSTE